MLGANRAPAAWLLLLAAVSAAVSAAAAADDEPLEDEVESAPFAIVVEHGEEDWRCGGALVSLRAALSTASCARGRGARDAPAPPADLWARAPGAATADGARRITRVALAVDSQGLSESEKWREKAWIGVVLDMALLELEAPFGAAAGARPILMAAGDECAPRAAAAAAAPAPACHVVRTPERAGGALRVGNAERASPMTCASVAPYWAAISDTALCLVGPQFCQSDWGAGVVCAGKLCGVLSRSARSPGASGDGDGGAACGDTHAALHVPRWQQFVHCAQTRRRCGRDSCASVCSERMLLEEPGEEGGGAARGGRRPATTTTPEDDYMKMRITTYSTQWPHSEAQSEGRRASSEGATEEPAWRRAGAGGGAGADVSAGTVPTRTSQAPPTPPPTPKAPLNASVATMGGRMVQFEFEPYRADFKLGEYVDNEASYEAVGGGGGGGGGGGEEPTRTVPSSTAPSSRAPGSGGHGGHGGPSPGPGPGAEALQEHDSPGDTNSTLMELTAGAGGARQLSANTFQIYLSHVFVILMLAR